MSVGYGLPVALPTHVESVSASPAATAPLSDQTLQQGGLVPVQAWMRTEKTRNALRVARSREKQEQNGMKQLNLLAPIDLHDLLRSVAKATPDEAQLGLRVQPGLDEQCVRKSCQSGEADDCNLFGPPPDDLSANQLGGLAKLSVDSKRRNGFLNTLVVKSAWQTYRNGLDIHFGKPHGDGLNGRSAYKPQGRSTLDGYQDVTLRFG